MNDANVDFLSYVSSDRDKLFSRVRPEEEKLRPVPWDAPYEWTETSMFGFNIPEHGIDAIIYYWHHPALKVVYGGMMIWEGLNSNAIACAFMDYRLAMPMPRDITDCTYANGVSVKMVRPLEEFDIAYDNPQRRTRLTLNLTAIMPPACRYNGGHITQAMRTKGELLLNGKSYTIDGFHCRDRSWGEARNESHLPMPPLNWTVGVFGEDFAFHHLSADNRRYRPEWGDRFPTINDTNNTMWGFLWDGTATHGVVSVDQRTRYAYEPFRPERVETTLQASNGKSYHITGRQIASTQIQCWPNMSGNFALMEWDWGGRKGFGDIQMCSWTDAYQLYDKLRIE